MNYMNRYLLNQKKIGYFFGKKEIKIIDKFGPDGVSKLVKIISNKSKSISNRIYL